MYSIQKTSAVLLVMLGLIVAAGCETTNEMPYQTMDLAEPVGILHKSLGGHPDLKEPGVMLIRSQAELDALSGDDLVGREVDFNSEQVIVATLGEMPTSGYWINITLVHEEGDLLQVYGQANKPADDEMAGQVLTYPYCAVVTPMTGASTIRDQITSVEGMEPPM